MGAIRELGFAMVLLLAPAACRPEDAPVEPTGVDQPAHSAPVRDAGPLAVPPAKVVLSAAHRPEHVACTPSPPSYATIDGGAMVANCVTDEECRLNTYHAPYGHGRCVFDADGGLGRCDDDLCLMDDDCKGGVCFCADDRRPTGLVVGPTNGNYCVAGNCQIDADCGAGFLCGPLFGYCGFFEGWYCHTAEDECTANYECPGGNCDYSFERGQWVCAPWTTCNG